MLQILQVAESWSGPPSIHALRWEQLLKTHLPVADVCRVDWNRTKRLDIEPDIVILHALNRKISLAELYRDLYPNAVRVGLSYNHLWWSGEKDNRNVSRDVALQAFSLCHLAFGNMPPGLPALPPAVNWREWTHTLDDSVFNTYGPATEFVEVLRARGWTRRAVYWSSEIDEALRLLGDPEVFEPKGDVAPEHMATLYRSSGAVIALREDGRPSYTVMEAILCGAVPIVSDCPAIRRMFPQQGVIYAKRDPHSIADAIVTALEMPDDVRCMHNSYALRIIAPFMMRGHHASAMVDEILGVWRQHEAVLPNKNRMGSDRNHAGWSQAVGGRAMHASPHSLRMFTTGRPIDIEGSETTRSGSSARSSYVENWVAAEGCRSRRALLTVCIPTFNRPAWTVDAIRSIIDQTFTDWELLIYNDGSTDDTLDRVLYFVKNLPTELRRKVVVVDGEENRGNGFCRSWFRENVRTEWMAWQDSDDISDRSRLKQQLLACLSLELDCCFTWLRRFHGSAAGRPIQRHRRFRLGAVRKIHVDRYSLDLQSLANNINSPTGLFNTAGRLAIPMVPIDHGGYDTVWISTMIATGLRIGCVNKPLYMLRQHNGRIVRRKRDKRYFAAREVERLKIWDLLNGLGMYNLGPRPEVQASSSNFARM